MVIRSLVDFGRRLGPKFLAFLLALAVFAYARLGAEREWRLRVPVEIRNLPSGLVFAGEPLEAVDLRVRGKGMEFLKLRMHGARVVLDLRDARPGRVQHRLGPGDLEIAGKVQPEVTEILSPRSITVDVDTVMTRRVAVRLALVGDLPSGLGLERPLRVEPSHVQVTGPSGLLRDIESLGTEPLWLDRLQASARRSLRVAPERGGLRVSPDSVVVEIALVHVESRRLPPLVVAVLGVAPNLTARVEPDSAAVTVSVPVDRSDAAISSQVMVFVDATSLPAGRHLLTPQVNLLAPELRLEGVQPGRVVVELTPSEP
jgi:hypothetical protein